MEVSYRKLLKIKCSPCLSFSIRHAPNFKFFRVNFDWVITIQVWTSPWFSQVVTLEDRIVFELHLACWDSLSTISVIKVSSSVPVFLKFSTWPFNAIAEVICLPKNPPVMSPMAIECQCTFLKLWDDWLTSTFSQSRLQLTRLLRQIRIRPVKIMAVP